MNEQEKPKTVKIDDKSDPLMFFHNPGETVIREKLIAPEETSILPDDFIEPYE